MMTKNQLNEREQLEMLTIEQLVPKAIWSVNWMLQLISPLSIH